MTSLGVDILAATGLVVLSGLFSGLTLGLMSLDIVDLQILVESGHASERKQAKSILPVRRNGNLLLCSLLIGNTITNGTHLHLSLTRVREIALLAIFLAGMTSGMLGLVLSSTLIVIFGEIVPQAICSRYGLIIGAKTIHFTRLLILCFFIFAYPISKVLDLVLGKEIGNLYSREELKTLISLHVENQEAREASGLTQEDTHIMKAVLEYHNRKVKDVMTPIDRVFKLESKTKLDFETILKIHRQGYTRIPVFEESENNIIGILFTKDLILINPDDKFEVKSVLAFHGLKQLQFVVEEKFLKETLLRFKSSYSHMMIVTSSAKDTVEGTLFKSILRIFLCVLVTGVITLEDVIEEILDDEIVDESDRFLDNTHVKSLSFRSNHHSRSEFLRLFGHRMEDQTRPTTEEVTGICAYLKSRLPEFSQMQDQVLDELIQRSRIVDTFHKDLEEMEEEEEALLIEVDDLSKPSHGEGIKDQCYFVYKLGERTTLFTLVLQGHVQIQAGHEKFISDIGPLGFLGTLALSEENYVPDFDAKAVHGCRILQIDKKDYLKALEQS